MKEERWLPIAGCVGLEVSDWGRVRSWRSSGRELRSEPALRALKTDKDGYQEVSLPRVGGKRIYRRVHALVLEAFVGPRPPGMICRHFPDRDPANNRLENLRWGTYVENERDKKQHGMSLAGARHHRAMAKLSVDQVRQIRSLLASGALSQRVIAKQFGVKQQAISKINVGQRWQHLLTDVASAR